MTLLTEALILGLCAMSLDLMVGYARLLSFGHAAAYGLGAYACGNLLLHTTMPLVFAVPLAAAFGGIVAIGVGWVCTLATGVSFSMLTLAFAQLLYAVAFKWTPVTGASDGLAGIPRSPARSASPSSPASRVSTISCFSGCSVPSCSAGRWSLAIRRGAARHPRERGEDYLARLQHTPLQDRDGGDLVRIGRAGRSAVRAIRRLCQYRAAVLAVLRPGTDHGDRRWRRHTDRTDHRCSVLPAGVQPAQFVDRFLGIVLRPDLHPVRAVRPARHLGSGDTRVHQRAVNRETRAMALLELDELTKRFGGIVAVDHVTMRVEAGEVRAVIGPNGAGKSTLFNLITGVVKATEGNVRFADETLTGLSRIASASVACRAPSSSPRCFPR